MKTYTSLQPDQQTFVANAFYSILLTYGKRGIHVDPKEEKALELKEALAVLFLNPGKLLNIEV